jgi:16S rRNA processing protein RimM
VKSAHGIRGEIYIQLNAGQADWLEDLNKLWLCPAGSTELRAWDVQMCRPHKEGLIVRLAGVPDRNAAEELRKQSIYIEESLLVAEPNDGFYLKQILGFTVVESSGAVVGEIVGFGSNGPQDLLRVRRDGSTEALIPLVEAFLRDIDFDKRVVTMDLPQGLFDL